VPDYPTDAYCAVCNESPESASHVLGPNQHDYVPPAYIVCSCPLHYHGVLHHIECARTGPRSERKTNNATVFAGARVKVEERPGMPQFGVLVGLLIDERGDTQAVVRLDHYGMFLKVLHPSKVTPVTPEQEDAYKP
jgi:hypothetical protein